MPRRINVRKHKRVKHHGVPVYDSFRMKMRTLYFRNLKLEELFRKTKAAEGWSIAAIRDAIERREHLV